MGKYLVVREYQTPLPGYHFFKEGQVVEKVGKDLYKGILLMRDGVQVIKPGDVREIV